MTRKDYELIAKVLEGLTDYEKDDPDLVSLTLVVEEFANILSAESDRFDFDKFVKACGLPLHLSIINYRL